MSGLDPIRIRFESSSGRFGSEVADMAGRGPVCAKCVLACAQHALARAGLLLARGGVPE